LKFEDNNSVIEWRKTCDICGLSFLDKMAKFGSMPFPIRVRDFKVDRGTCETCIEKRELHNKMLFFARDLHWTLDSVKEYFTVNPPFKGQELIVLDTSWRQNTYVLVSVDKPNHGHQKRIIINSYSNGYSGQSFYRSGKSCWAPTGQVRLLPYNVIVGNLIKKGNGNSITLNLEQILKLVGEKESSP